MLSKLFNGLSSIQSLASAQKWLPLLFELSGVKEVTCIGEWGSAIHTDRDRNLSPPLLRKFTVLLKDSTLLNMLCIVVVDDELSWDLKLLLAYRTSIQDTTGATLSS